MKQIKPVLQKLYRSAQFFDETDRTQYVRMDTNESVDGLPEDFVKETLGKVTPTMLATYPNPKKCTEAIASYLGVKREKVLLTNGSDAAIKMFFEVYINEGDRVIIASPAFEMYEVYCKMYGAVPVNVNYKEDFAFPREEYMQELKKGAKLAIITNPNNPTGTALDEKSVREILDIAKKQDTLVMIDEAYYWIYDKTMLSLLEDYHNMLLLRTFSKILGLAGIRLGVAVADEEMIQDLKKVALSAGVNTLALLFGEELIKRPDLIDKLVSDFKREKNYFKEQLEKNSIEYLDTDANYLLLPFDGDPVNVKNELKKEGILVAFKMNKYLRVNIGNEILIDKFITAYGKWKKCEGECE